MYRVFTGYEDYNINNLLAYSPEILSKIESDGIYFDYQYDAKLIIIDCERCKVILDKYSHIKYYSSSFKNYNIYSTLIDYIVKYRRTCSITKILCM